MSVSAFVERLNAALKATFPDTWVKGEVGEWRVWASGHAYFTLKDARATLQGMMWSAEVRRLPFRVEAGMEVLALGRPDVYAPNGRLSFVVSELQPAGLGALQLAFEQLKRRLAEEGLFDPARKRSLPLLPRRIGVVTSRHGAALRDVLKVLAHRFPEAHVVVYPVAVQGERAPQEIARALAAFSRAQAADVVLVARGGGSKEDLAAFNDERVVRAVAASAIPTISAVGHEVDVTLTDLAADVRAATPSQAAELVVARRDEFEGLLERRGREMASALRGRVLSARNSLMALEGDPALSGLPARSEAASREVASLHRGLVGAVRALPARFGERLSLAESRVASWPERSALSRRLAEADAERRALSDRIGSRLLRAREALGETAGRLSALDPLRVLSRGYGVVYAGESLSPLTDAERVEPGQPLRILLARGELGAAVTRVVKATETDRGRER